MYPAVSPGDYWLCRMKRDHSSSELKPKTVVLFPKEGLEFLLTKRIIAVENETIEVRGRETVINHLPLFERSRTVSNVGFADPAAPP